MLNFSTSVLLKNKLIYTLEGLRVIFSNVSFWVNYFFTFMYSATNEKVMDFDSLTENGVDSLAKAFWLVSWR